MKNAPLFLSKVAILLGHSTPLVTAKYYSHFVKSRRERLEERVKTLWDAEGVA